MLKVRMVIRVSITPPVISSLIKKSTRKGIFEILICTKDRHTHSH